jgi:ABC-2 type transport system permease protein
MRAVFKRELLTCMSGLRGWGYAALMLLASGIAVAYYNLYSGSAEILYALTFAEYALIPAVPMLCADSMARDRRDGTDRLLRSLPCGSLSVVLGKYLALVCAAALPVAVLCLYPLLFSLYGTVNFAASYTSILNFFLLSAAFAAVCQFLSSLTTRWPIAFGTGTAVLLLLYFLPILMYFLPTSPWVSYAALVLVALLTAGAGFLFTRSPLVSAVTGIVLTAALTAGFLLQKEYFGGLFYDLTLLLSPFMRYEEAGLYGLLDMNTLLLLLAVPLLFLWLTTAVTERRRCR